MKILYVINDEFTKDSGVLKKVNNQISYWYDQGVKTHLFIIGVNKEAKKDFIFSDKISSFTYFNSPTANLFSGSIYRNLNRILCVSSLLKLASDSSIDLIYLREITYFPYLNKILTRKPSIVEVNSIYINEIRHLPAQKRKVLQANQQKLFNAVAGFVCVTNEIANQIIPYNKPWICCSNGMDTKKYGITPTNVHEKTQIIMVCSPGMAWHGVEKLAILASNFPSITFHLVGPTLDFTSPNLIQHGILSSEKLGELYKKMNIAIGTLSMYKNDMNENCSLKVREYLMHGLPIIMGGHDVDIGDQPFVLELGNYENNVSDHISEIEQFIESNKNKRVALNEFEELISFESKEKLRLDFFKKICSA